MFLYASCLEQHHPAPKHIYFVYTQGMYFVRKTDRIVLSTTTVFCALKLVYFEDTAEKHHKKNKFALDNVFHHQSNAHLTTKYHD